MSHDASVISVMDGKNVMKSKGLSSIEYHGDDNNARHEIKSTTGRYPVSRGQRHQEVPGTLVMVSHV